MENNTGSYNKVDDVVKNTLLTIEAEYSRDDWEKIEAKLNGNSFSVNNTANPTVEKPTSSPSKKNRLAYLLFGMGILVSIALLYNYLGSDDESPSIETPAEDAKRIEAISGIDTLKTIENTTPIEKDTMATITETPTEPEETIKTETKKEEATETKTIVPTVPTKIKDSNDVSIQKKDKKIGEPKKMENAAAVTIEEIESASLAKPLTTLAARKRTKPTAIESNTVSVKPAINSDENGIKTETQETEKKKPEKKIAPSDEIKKKNKKNKKEESSPIAIPEDHPKTLREVSPATEEQ